MIKKMNTLAGLGFYAALGAAGVAHADGKVDGIVNTQGTLIDVIGTGKIPFGKSPLYSSGFARARAMHTLAERGDNVFLLAEANVGYQGFTLGLQQRFSELTDYQVASFGSVGLQKKVKNEEGELLRSGAVSFAMPLSDPRGFQEMRLAGSVNPQSKRKYVPDRIEGESFTWKKSDVLDVGIWSGTGRFFVGYEIGKLTDGRSDGLTVGPYAEMSWSVSEGVGFFPGFFPGLKVRYQ